MINKISRTEDPTTAFKDICDILDIENTSFYDRLKEDLEGIQDNPELTEELKRKSVADLLIALGEAKENFKEAENNNKDFQEKIRNFFARNT